MKRSSRNLRKSEGSTSKKRTRSVSATTPCKQMAKRKRDESGDLGESSEKFSRISESLRCSPRKPSRCSVPLDVGRSNAQTTASVSFRRSSRFSVSSNTSSTGASPSQSRSTTKRTRTTTVTSIKTKADSPKAVDIISSKRGCDNPNITSFKTLPNTRRGRSQTDNRDNNSSSVKFHQKKTSKASKRKRGCTVQDEITTNDDFPKSTLDAGVAVYANESHSENQPVKKIDKVKSAGQIVLVDNSRSRRKAHKTVSNGQTEDSLIRSSECDVQKVAEINGSAAKLSSKPRNSVDNKNCPLLGNDDFLNGCNSVAVSSIEDSRAKRNRRSCSLEDDSSRRSSKKICVDKQSCHSDGEMSFGRQSGRSSNGVSTLKDAISTSSKDCPANLSLNTKQNNDASKTDTVTGQDCKKVVSDGDTNGSLSNDSVQDGAKNISNSTANKETDHSCEVDLVENGSWHMETKVEIVTLLTGFGLDDQQCSEISTFLNGNYKTNVTSAAVRSLTLKLLRNPPQAASTLSTPRCNRLLKQLIEHYCSYSEVTHEDKYQLCQECMSWARENRRAALSHELQVTLMELYASTGLWRKAEQTASGLYATIKNMQDKEKTVKACLCLSTCYHAFGNLPKARAFITTAKTEALKMYTPPELQAELDLQSGILQIAEGKDIETAISYFKEAATGSPNSKLRARSLKYLVLGYLLQGRPTDAHKVAHSPVHINDIDDGVVAMLAVADSASTASVRQFRTARAKFTAELKEDPVIKPLLDQIYSDMIEKNIINIIMPYNRVQITHVAERIELPREEVERRLSQMILDSSLSGQLDHRDQCLYVYPKDGPDPVCEAAQETISHLEKTITHLFNSAKKLL